ncbi:MAG: tRNA pseudouridine(38-40) synthase TruA [Tepidisphaeraceae bacterium]
MDTQRYKLTIAYRGTRYHGWQEQGHANTWKGPVPEDGSGPPTIQELMRRALEEVVRHPVALVGSSRTDAGVHAKGQVAHFDTHMTQIPPEGLRRGVNSRLPDDILIRSIERVPSTFDAIRNTVEKRYQYVIWNAPDRPPFFGELVFHRFQPLDIAAMQRAAAVLVGEHDFATFAKPGHGRQSTVRTVHECSVHARGPRVIVGVRGSGFLWNMVRIIAGTLIEIGLGRLSADDMPAMLAACDRRAAGLTAPAQGLYLQWIRFSEPESPAAQSPADQSAAAQAAGT